MPLQVIGAGLGRTGTMSLKLALEELGFGPCYHMSEVAGGNGAFPLWVEAAKGNADWEKIFEGYSSTTDYPACSFWRALAAFYPDAKVILSLRDPVKWFESVNTTIFSSEMSAHLTGSPMQEFFEKCVWAGFGARITDKDFMVEAFNRHNEAVMREIPEERLLVYETGQGWKPLCEFLGVPVPASAYPRANTREDFLSFVIPAIREHRFGSSDMRNSAVEGIKQRR
jgi:hypothetical protein